MKTFNLLAVLLLASCARAPQARDHWFMREGFPLPSRAEQETDFATCARDFLTIGQYHNCLYVKGYGREVTWK